MAYGEMLFSVWLKRPDLLSSSNVPFKFTTGIIWYFVPFQVCIDWPIKYQESIMDLLLPGQSKGEEHSECCCYKGRFEYFFLRGRGRYVHMMWKIRSGYRHNPRAEGWCLVIRWEMDVKIELYPFDWKRHIMKTFH